MYPYVPLKLNKVETSVYRQRRIWTAVDTFNNSQEIKQSLSNKGKGLERFLCVQRRVLKRF